MNIKSFLLGSATAMVAVSGAQAADAVVVDPEPVEYVRVCDAYGSGFFYIPGTETCIKFGGYVRTFYAVTHTTTGGVETSATDWASRARMQIDTRNETDWGTLRAFFRLDTDLRGSGSQAAQLDRALISIGDSGGLLRAGFGANYWTTNHGFAGVNLAGLFGEDGPYFGTTTAATMLDYTWAADGFSLTGGFQTTSALGGLSNPGAFQDWYVGGSYSGDLGGLAFTYINDSNGGAAGGDGDAWKVSVDIDLSDMAPGALLHGMYMTDDDDTTEYVAADGGNASEIWQISGQVDMGDEMQLVAQYSDIEYTGGTSGDVLGVGVNWFPSAAPGFLVYAAYLDQTNRSAANTERDGFVLRLRRNF